VSISCRATGLKAGVNESPNGFNRKVNSLTPALRPVIRRGENPKPFQRLSSSFHSFTFVHCERAHIPTMDSTNRHAVEELLQTYGETGGINYLAAAATLPSRLAIEATCAELMSLMFPGFRSEALVSSEDLVDATRTRIRNLHARLKTEICRSLGKIPPDESTEAKAEEVLAMFLKELPAVRRLLWTDIDAAYEGDPAARSYEEIILAYPALEAVATYRMAHLLYEKVPLIPRIMTEWAHSRTGIDIHPGAQIGSHFFIDHGTGVVIGETTEIGARVKLYHAVTLGARSFQKDEHGKIKKGGKRHPTVEDDVTIYPGSTILGGETVIGARSTIGGNVFLVQSVPPDSLVYYEEKQLRIVPKRKKLPATTRDEFRE
jgi:serine O-acetyltransferase